VINKEQHKIIEKYVDDTYYDKEKLLKYLEMHNIVGNEVFQYCDRQIKGEKRATYSNFLNYEYGYCPLTVNDFIRRIPFYFYTVDNDSVTLENMGVLHYVLAANMSDDFENCNLEKIYKALEFMFYDLKLPLNKIFSYWINQSGSVAGDLFMKWNHYLHLCQELGYNNYFPDRFISSYNQILEELNLPPIIYEISDSGICEAYFRRGNILEFEGTFPCDDTGKPIMKWIGVRAKNPGEITCTSLKSKRGSLKIKINPDTIIHVLNFYNGNDEEDTWYQVYAGPKTMEFDYRMLKIQRKNMGYTQQQVADAIETNVRTYQKWESGETTPDGYFLLRLLNWLDISDIQTVISYKDFDDMLEA